MRVGLATWSELPALSPDDQRLGEALATEGIAAVPGVWTDPSVRWESFELVVIRSTWDYHRRLPEFLRWVDRVSSSTRLFNVASTIRWNCRKTYLRDLAAAGVPTVPTAWGSEISEAVPELRRRGWDPAVVKPAVSANADRTYRVTLADASRTETIFHELRQDGEVLLQPYVSAVDGPGEHSLVFFDGRLSHAVVRAPRLAPGSTLVEGTPIAFTEAEAEVGRRALATVEPPPLYARVDLVNGPTGRPWLAELELIEPYLYFASAPGSADALARAIRGRLSPTRWER